MGVKTAPRQFLCFLVQLLQVYLRLPCYRLASTPSPLCTLRHLVTFVPVFIWVLHSFCVWLSALSFSIIGINIIRTPLSTTARHIYIHCKLIPHVSSDSLLNHIWWRGKHKGWSWIINTLLLNHLLHSFELLIIAYSKTQSAFLSLSAVSRLTRRRPTTTLPETCSL